ncbi:MAG TPA: ArsA-related P-loop ATPase, partial [Longimicrobiales bacterium]|nr:ArsA-related P-loop ATPase [Longimicrobiales bacterium]
MTGLLEAVGDADFVFVTGKGGTGKTTTAGGLSLEVADSGTPTHLISTDPAHSLADLFQHPVGGHIKASGCSELLRIEEFDAAAAGDAWLARALGPVTAIVEAGTYLDGDDVAAFSRLALPGIDEMMAVLRLVQLQDEYGGSAPGTRTRVVVDTAPTGHTLRLLDAADTYEGIARALRAMADKAAAVAGAMTGRAVHMAGEDIIDELERVVAAYRERVLAPAAFVIAARGGSVVEAESRRLAEELRRRSLRVAAVVVTGRTGTAPLAGIEAFHVDMLEGLSGCDGLRMWRDHVGAGRPLTSGPGPRPGWRDN